MKTKNQKKKTFLFLFVILVDKTTTEDTGEED